MAIKTKPDYAPGHAVISRDFRAERGFVCDECRVDLKHAPYCADLHHRNHEKGDYSHFNLSCLCKLCHAALHPHYYPCDKHRRIIEDARKKQGITYPPVAEGQGTML